MVLRSEGPYIWATWLAKLLAGDSNCLWATWFKARYESRSWVKAPKPGLGLDQWAIEHTALVNRSRGQLDDEGYTTFVEDQNYWRLRGQAATVAGKPDVIAVNGSSSTIVDAKTGQPRPSHQTQVMLYIWAVPLALPQHAGRDFDGLLVYPEHEVRIPADAVDEAFVAELVALIRLVSAQQPPLRAPSGPECRFCDITEQDCPERVEWGVREAATAEF